MVGVRREIDANEPVVRVFVRPLVLWGLPAWAGTVGFIVAGAALADLGWIDAAVAPGFWWFGVPFALAAAAAVAVFVCERLDPTPAVEIRPKRFTLRQPLLIWTKGRTVEAADVARLWAEGTGTRTPFGGGDDPDRLCVHLTGGRVIRYEAGSAAVGGVELERLIRETTGLDVPGRPAAGRPAGRVRPPRAAPGAD